MSTLKTIASYTSPIEAHIAKGRLEAEGIQAFIADEHHIWANWMYSNALGGVKIQVREEDAEQAKTILEQDQAGEFEEQLDEVFEDIKANACPNCGSKEFTSTFPFISLLLVILTLGLISVFFKVRRDRHRCLQCKQDWKF